MCTFKKWFEQQLAACKLTAAENVAWTHTVFNMSIDDTQEMHDAPVHFHHLDSSANWESFAFGALIWREEHQELLKLQALFQILRHKVGRP